jgi:hypothetical protein
MAQRKVKYKANEYIKECPKCGNNTEFTIHSDQCSEDCCEIWATCKCGHNPTSENSLNRVEDVWGTLDDGNCRDAIDYTWNEMIADAEIKK